MTSAKIRVGQVTRWVWVYISSGRTFLGGFGRQLEDKFLNNKHEIISHITLNVLYLDKSYK